MSIAALKRVAWAAMLGVTASSLLVWASVIKEAVPASPIPSSVSIPSSTSIPSVAVIPTPTLPLPAVASASIPLPSAVDPVVTPTPARTPTATKRATPRPTRRPPTPAPVGGAVLVRGWATFWPAQGAAASKWLAEAMGGGTKYLGKTVTVCIDAPIAGATAVCVDVKLVTSCACGDRHGEHTVIDLPEWAFEDLAGPLWRQLGVIHVTVRR